MASVILGAATATAPTHERIVSLLDWLEGHWAIVMSHPDDFAPPPTTPTGFTNRLADQMLAADVKPIAFGHSLELMTPNWLDHAVNDDAVVLLDTNGDRIVDLAERALATRLATCTGRFVSILDERGRCRTILHYVESLRTRPRTLRDLMEIVAVLRGQQTDRLRRAG